MASGLITFENFTLNEHPQGFTRRINTADHWRVREDASGDRYLVFDFSGGVSNAFYGLSASETPNAQDGEIALEIEVDGSAANPDLYKLVFLRADTVDGTGSTVNQGSVYAGANTLSNDRIRVYTDSGTTTLVDQSVTPARELNTRYRLRGRVQGDQVFFKFWLASETEPEAWDYQETNPEAAISGWFGVATFRPDAGVRIHRWAWATDGDVATFDAASTVSPGIPATTLNNADGTPSTGTAITRTITRVSDNLQLFTGSQTSDATTGELPEIDLSETDAAVDDVVEDSVSIGGATAPGVKSTTVLRTVGDLGA